MNTYKHPKFTKDLGHAINAPTEDEPYSEMVFETLLSAGINPAEPIYTVDGDRVRLLAIDTAHSFPLVGEVIDFGAETTWLGRWSASGVYASSKLGAQKHALKPNDQPGRLYLDPAVPEPADVTMTVEEYMHLDTNEATERAADFDRCIGDTVYKTQVPRIVKNLTKKLFGAGPALRPQPQVDRAGSGGRVRGASESEYDAAYAEAVKRVEKEAADRAIDPPLVDKTHAGLAWIDDELAPITGIGVSDQIIRNAKDIIGRWLLMHRADPALRTVSWKHLDIPHLRSVYMTACVESRISHMAHLWSMSAVYVMAGRLRFYGPLDAVDSSDIDEALHFLDRTDDPRLTYAIAPERAREAA